MSEWDLKEGCERGDCGLAVEELSQLSKLHSLPAMHYSVSRWMGKNQSCEVPSKKGQNAFIPRDDAREATGMIQIKL